MTNLPRLLICGVVSIACPLVAHAQPTTQASTGAAGRFSTPTHSAQDAHAKPGIQPDAFPEADPESVGIPPRALEILTDRVQAMVDNKELIGGELIVIKNRRTVLREAFGWKDREAEEPLEVDALYCVRSMTKPFVGTAIQMLIDEGKLTLETPVHEILPFFDTPQTSMITIEHLLTHTAGYPFTTITKPLSEYADLSAVAEEVAATKLLFKPGARFEYSDGGSDTLGAVVAQITGAPVEQFIQERILDPLAMHDSVTLLAGHEETKARIPAAYSGGTASWSKHWDPSKPSFFPIFLTSQSLYSTTTDYARFLTLWMDDGRLGDEQLISTQAVERALSPNMILSGYPQIIDNMDIYYGQQWMVYTQQSDDGSTIPVLFGHNGSDGTHAWAWPEQDLMVLFFTQSRGTLAGVSLEGILHTLLIEQKLDDPSLANRVPTADELAQVAGLYWDQTSPLAYYSIGSRGDRLTLDRPGRMHLEFKASPTPGRFVHEINPQVWIEFVRSEAGEVTAMRTSFGGAVEIDPRHTPQGGLPSVEEVIATIERTHNLDRLQEIGAVRLAGTLSFVTRGMEATIESHFDLTRQRTEINISTMQEISVINDGNVWSYSTTAGASEVEGQLRDQALVNSYAARFGDWTDYFEHVQVLNRTNIDDMSILLVRLVPHEAPESLMFIDESTGHIRHMESLAIIPGLGTVGISIDFDDYRDVEGMQLPFRIRANYATDLLGRIDTQIDEVETGVAVTDEMFKAPTAHEK